MIGTRPRPRCPVCGTSGTVSYQGLADHLYGVEGAWTLKTCPAPACGSAWLDPTPTPEDLWQAYETYYTHATLNSPNGPVVRLLGVLRDAYLRGRLGYHHDADRAWRRHLAPAAAVVFGLLPGARDAVLDSACHLPAHPSGGQLLEIGFGNATQLERMRTLGWDVQGVDVDPVSVAAAHGKGLRVRQGDLVAQAFPDGTFDAIYASHVIEHVHEPLSLLRECYRILRPNGRLVIITPNLKSWGHRQFRGDWMGLDVPRHLVLFTRAGLSRLAGQAGFAILRQQTSARIGALVWLGSSQIRLSSAVMTSGRPLPPIRTLLTAVAAQIFESAMLKLRPDAGEEIVLCARKQR